MAPGEGKIRAEPLLCGSSEVWESRPALALGTRHRAPAALIAGAELGPALPCPPRTLIAVTSFRDHTCF